MGSLWKSENSVLTLNTMLTLPTTLYIGYNAYILGQLSCQLLYRYIILYRYKQSMKERSVLA